MSLKDLSVRGICFDNGWFLLLCDEDMALSKLLALKVICHIYIYIFCVPTSQTQRHPDHLAVMETFDSFVGCPVVDTGR